MTDREQSLQNKIFFQKELIELKTEAIKNLEKENTELKAQIEKMKCCANCQTVRDAEGNCYLEKDGKCKDKDKWVLRR